MIKRLFAAVAALLFIATPAMAATTMNVPFLTWENGKQQSIVLGGPGSDSRWIMQLEGGKSAPLKFTQKKNSAGQYIYSLNVPRSLTPGGYVIQAVESNGTKTVVAGVQIKQRETYQISQIPTDLRLLAVIFAALTALFSVVRGRKYARLSFSRRSVEDSGNILYRFRNVRLASGGNSLARYLALHSGEAVHRISPIIWSVLPWLALPLGVYTAIAIQFDAAIPNGPIALFFICAVIGALDATAGIALALGLGFTHVALGNVTNLRSLLVAVTFTMSWYLPSMLGSLVKLTVRRDFGKLSAQATSLISTLMSALTGGVVVVMATILTDSLVINREASTLLRWPLAGAVAGVLLIKGLLEDLNTREGYDENLFLARVISPNLAITLFAGTLLLVYVWTNQFVPTLVASLVIAAPYFLSFLVFPSLGRKKIDIVDRNLVIEVLLVVALTYGVYFAIQQLPLAVVSKSRAFILLGLLPALLHGVYSVFIASSEFAAKREEMEAVS